MDAGAAAEFFTGPALSLLVHALLSERRVLVLGLSPSSTGDVVLSLMALLAPLRWAHTAVPWLPKKFCGLLAAPQPWLVGMHPAQLSEVAELHCGSMVVASCVSGRVALCNGAQPIPDVTLRAAAPPSGQPCCMLRGAAGWRAPAATPAGSSRPSADDLVSLAALGPLDPGRLAALRDAKAAGRAGAAMQGRQEARGKALERRHRWGVHASEWRPPTLPGQGQYTWRAVSLVELLAGAGLEPVKGGELAQDIGTAASPESAGPSMAMRAALAFGDLRRKFGDTSLGQVFNGGGADSRVTLGSGALRVTLPVDACERWGAELSDAFARASSGTSELTLAAEGVSPAAAGAGDASRRASGALAADAEGQAEAPGISGGGDGVVDADRLRAITAAFVCSIVTGALAYVRSSAASSSRGERASLVDQEAWVKAEAAARPVVAAALVGGPLSQSLLLGMGMGAGSGGKIQGIAAAQAVEQLVGAIRSATSEAATGRGSEVEV